MTGSKITLESPIQGRYKEVRPEVVRKGMGVATVIRAGATYPTHKISERAVDTLLKDLETVEHINEADLYKHVIYGTVTGHRKPPTERQIEILQLYADGKLAKQIAAELNITVAGIMSSMTGVKFALDCRTNEEAVAKAVASGLISANPLPKYKTVGAKVTKHGRDIIRSTTREPNRLTSTELNLLALLSTGLTLPEISEKLKISFHTMKTQLKSIYTKLNAVNRTQAVVIGIEKGLLEVVSHVEAKVVT